MRISDWSSDVCSSDLRVRIAKVVGSIPIRSTIPSSGNPGNPAIGGVFARSSARGASTLGREKNLLLSRPSRPAQREVVGRNRIGLGPQRGGPPLVGGVGKPLPLQRRTAQMHGETLRRGSVRRRGATGVESWGGKMGGEGR